MKASIVYAIILILITSCSLSRGASWRLKKTGKYEFQNTASIDQESTGALDEASMYEQEIPMFIRHENSAQLIESDKQQGQKENNDITIQHVSPERADSTRKSRFPFKHKNEIVMAKKGEGYVFLFLLSALLTPLFLVVPLPMILYGIHVHDPREPLWRLNKYKRVFRRYKALYIIDCLGAIALSVMIILFGEPMGGIFLLALIPGIIALVASHKLQKKSEELISEFELPDVSEHLEEFVKPLFRLKMWRWIGFIGMIPVLPLWFLLEMIDAIQYAE